MVKGDECITYVIYSIINVIGLGERIECFGTFEVILINILDRFFKMQIRY